jgi:hypothetical protein
MPKQKKRKSDWSRFEVKENGVKRARVIYSASDSNKYQAFKTRANVTRTQGFGHRQEKVAGNVKRALVSGTLRRRNPGADRDVLTNIGVLNPLFVPAINNKSHLLPDILGGPSIQQNLINEHQSINLSAHKPVENRIDRFIAAATPAGERKPLKRRGSIVIVDSFHPTTGVPIQRDYHVHTDAGNGVAERFDKFTVKHL